MTIKRAHSALHIKSVDEDNRTFTGIATTPEVDSYGDIVESKGAVYQSPIALLWQHRHDSPVGYIRPTKITKEGIEVEGEIAQTNNPGTIKDRLDEAWESLKLKLVRGLSIGFSPIEFEPLEKGGYRFTSWRWLELSLVTIPANVDATIQTIRSIDSQVLAASGNTPEPKPALRVRSKITSRNNIMDINEQLKGFAAARKEKADRMTEIMNKSAENGETLDPELTEEYDTLEAEIESIDKHVKRLKSLERLNAQQAEPVPETPAAPSEAPVIGAVPRKPLLKDGLAMGQLVRYIGLAKGSEDRALKLALNDNRTDPRVASILKAAVEAGTTDPSSWTGDLVGEETTVFADFVEFLRPQTIIGRFGSGGIPSLRSVPFRTPLITQTAGGEGYWTGEGKAKPLTKFDYSRTTLEPLKVANIAVVTKELLRSSSPSADGLIRDQLVAALRHRLDVDFIDPAKAASTGVSPASITNSVSPIPSAGDSEDDVRADIQAVFGAFIAQNNAPTSGVWIMSNTTALALSLMHNVLGNRAFPDITMNGGVLWGLPVIASENVPADSTGHYVALVNANDIYLGDDGGFTVDMSEQASLQMDNEPTMDSDTPTAVDLVSMWQTNSVAFRAEREINWMRRRAHAVQLLSGVNWGTQTSG